MLIVGFVQLLDSNLYVRIFKFIHCICFFDQSHILFASMNDTHDNEWNYASSYFTPL